MEGLRCRNCKKTSYVPPTAQHIHCYGCRKVYSVGTSNDSDFLVNYKGTKEWSVDFTKKITEAKLVCHRLREKQSQTGMLPLTVSTTDHYRRSKEWSQELTKKKTEAKHLSRTSDTSYAPPSPLHIDCYGFEIVYQ